VNGKQFEVNYFYATPAYHNTLAHGGVLGGTFTRAFTITTAKFCGSTSGSDKTDRLLPIRFNQ